MCFVFMSLSIFQLIFFLSSPSTAAIGDNTLRSVTDSYLGIGETIFEMIQATAVNSPYFKRDTK